MTVRQGKIAKEDLGPKMTMLINLQFTSRTQYSNIIKGRLCMAAKAVGQPGVQRGRHEFNCLPSVRATLGALFLLDEEAMTGAQNTLKPGIPKWDLSQFLIACWSHKHILTV